MILYRFRFLYIALGIIGLCFYFWVFSRYPDLNRKAMMASHANIADTIAMFPILAVDANDPFWKKVAYTTVNWAHDNRRGMAFGVVLGALFVTIFEYLRLKPGRSPLVRTLQGFLLGTPMGVCVNCAAPVFKGVLASREKELAFAMMLSSPTMNIVVLTITFTLFPFYMAATKVLFTLAMIFVSVPLIARLLGPNHRLTDFEKLKANPATAACEIDAPVKERAGSALLAALRDFGRNLWMITRTTVPLMFVAGFLGALVSHLVPMDRIVGHAGIGVTLLAAAVGLFLPVPMAFDVILTNALFTSGLSPALSLVLLCTLGIFSSYSFMMTWRAASKQWALGITAAAYVLAVALGLGGSWMHKAFYVQPNVRDFQALQASSRPERPGVALSAKSLGQAAPALTHEVAYEDADVRVVKYPFLPRGPATGRFVKREGAELGLDRGFTYGIRDYPDPFWIGRGTASGDYKNTGWPGIAFGSDEGVFLYENVGGRFVPDQGLPPELKKYRVYAVAFVDWTGSGWLDLFVTTFNQGNFLIRNLGGSFAQKLEPVPNGKGILTVSPSLGAFGADGSIGVYNGNMALGVITAFSHFGDGRRDSLTLRAPGGSGYEERVLPGLDGETMASLASDFDGDGLVDVYANTDFIVPDHLYLGRPGGTLEEAPEALRQTLSSPFFSMSIDTGDLDNDLIMDYVATGTTNVAAWVGKAPIDGADVKAYAKPEGGLDDCEKIKDTHYRDNCILNRKTDHLIPFYENRNLRINDCKQLTDPVAFDDCLLSVMWMIVTNNATVTNCAEEFGFDAHIKEVCEIFVRRGAPYRNEQFAKDIPQVDTAVAFYGQKGGGFRRVAFEHPGGWTWSTKIADLDNDGWQDVFNAEGAIRVGEYGFNALMHNRGGQGFEQRQFSMGLDDPLPLYSFTFIDFNHDGRLDIVGNSSLGPVQVYENQLEGGHSVAIAIRKPGPNARGINDRILVTDEAGNKQIREIKAGGGYQSFDDYRAWFGLGNRAALREIKLQLKGREKVITADLAADALYVVEVK